MNSLGFLNISSTNCFEFIYEFIRIHQQIHLNSLKFINECIWIHQQIQLNLSTDSFKIFTNFLKISPIFIMWIFWENHQWIQKWIHWIESKLNHFFAFSKFLVISLNFLSNFWQMDGRTDGQIQIRALSLPTSRSRDWKRRN